MSNKKNNQCSLQYMIIHTSGVVNSDLRELFLIVVNYIFATYIAFNFFCYTKNNVRS
jgi:hypothetical protein